MASGSNYLTTYYAKRIIGDNAAQNASSALLQTGPNIATSTWILHRDNRTSKLYGIKYNYDDSVNGEADTIELYGGKTDTQNNNVDIPTAWVQLDTGDSFFNGNMLINGICTVDNNIVASGTITGASLYNQHTIIDITNASNGLTADDGCGFFGLDKNDKDYTKMMSFAWTDGYTGLQLQARNHSGAAYTNYGGITIKASKASDDISYEVTTPANFRTAIGAMDSTTVVTNVAVSANVTTDDNYALVFTTNNVATTIASEESLQKNGAELYFNPYTGILTSVKVANAIWNDYAEYRQSKFATPGYCVQENDNGCLTLANKRLIPGASIITDTWGYVQGRTKKADTPIAVSGRVLAYTYQPRECYHAGMAVCSAPNGTIDIMTKREIRKHPDAIIGIVSEIPDYEEWGTGHVKVDGRIWIKVK